MKFSEMTLHERYSDPLDHILNCYELGMLPTQFDVLNAKDELRKLRDTVKYAYQDAYLANTTASDDTNRWIEAEKDRARLSEENKVLKDSLRNVVAWARTNDRGDLYDMRNQLNPYLDTNTVVPLIRQTESVKSLLDNADK